MIIERVGDLMEALMRFDPHDRLDFEVEVYDEAGIKDVNDADFAALERNRYGHVQLTLTTK